MEDSNFFDLQFRSQITDYRRRKKYMKKELNQTVLKSVLEISFNDYLLNSSSRSKTNSKNFLKTLTSAKNQLQHYKQNTYTRIRNRCVLSGRNTTLKRFRQSRICFREQAGLGLLTGVSKKLNK